MNRLGIAGLLLTAFLAFTGCGLFGPSEEVRREPKKTFYRSADPGPGEISAETLPRPAKVPGE
jgi:hypothetical protein